MKSAWGEDGKVFGKGNQRTGAGTDGSGSRRGKKAKIFFQADIFWLAHQRGGKKMSR